MHSPLRRSINAAFLWFKTQYLEEKVCYPEGKARVKGASSCSFLNLYF